MTLDEFRRGLENATSWLPNCRPFICQGSPLSCDVFIVGYNPATKMDGDWWTFWKDGYGYQQGAWNEKYLEQRQGKSSKTRKCIEQIVAGLNGERVLETNIDARPSARMSEYPQPITKPFDYLLEACAPKVIIAHGVDAVAHLQSWKSKGKELIECKHFIYIGKVGQAKIVADTKAALARQLGGA